MVAPALSIIVAFHNMAREAPRTLYTLSPGYQRGVSDADYEGLAEDVGSSAVPLDPDFVAGFGPNFRLHRAPAAPSPAAAINQTARLATGDAIAVCIDGARMLSPGIIRLMLAAFRAYADPVVATLAWHLGPKPQNESMLDGYDQALEDQLLDSVDWRAVGYELFRISCLAYSSRPGWFRPIAESNCLAVRRPAWGDSVGSTSASFRRAAGS